MNETIAKKIQITSRQIKRKLDGIFQSAGLTGTQAFVLFFVYETSKKQKVYAKDIVNEFDMRKSTVTGLIQNLEQNDLIETRSEEKDSRMKEIVLTRKAIEKMTNVDEKIMDLNNVLSSNVSDEELQIFFYVLDKISKNTLNTLSTI